MKKIELGEKARDRVSGFTGIVTARTEYLYSTPSVRLSPESTDATGKLVDAVWFDESQVEVTEGKRSAGFSPA